MRGDGNVHFFALTDPEKEIESAIRHAPGLLANFGPLIVLLRFDQLKIDERKVVHNFSLVATPVANVGARRFGDVGVSNPLRSALYPAEVGHRELGSLHGTCQGRHRHQIDRKLFCLVSQRFGLLASDGCQRRVEQLGAGVRIFSFSSSGRVDAAPKVAVEVAEKIVKSLTVTYQMNHLGSLGNFGVWHPSRRSYLHAALDAEDALTLEFGEMLRRFDACRCLGALGIKLRHAAHQTGCKH